MEVGLFTPIFCYSTQHCLGSLSAQKLCASVCVRLLCTPLTLQPEHTRASCTHTINGQPSANPDPLVCLICIYPPGLVAGSPPYKVMRQMLPSLKREVRAVPYARIDLSCSEQGVQKTHKHKVSVLRHVICHRRAWKVLLSPAQSS